MFLHMFFSGLFGLIYDAIQELFYEHFVMLNLFIFFLGILFVEITIIVYLRY